MSATESVKLFIEDKNISWEKMGKGVKRKIMSGNYIRKDAIIGKEGILAEIQSGKLK